MSQSIKERKHGFTLVELLVVISIIGFLSALSLIFITNARIKGRDATRSANIEIITKSLELYFNHNQKFPDCAGVGCNLTSASGGRWLTGLNEDFINPMPLDPINKTGFVYKYKSNAGGTEYAMSYYKEQTGEWLCRKVGEIACP